MKIYKLSKSVLSFLCILHLSSLIPLPAQAETENSLNIADMTWMEVRDRIAQGSDIVLVPTGGTEQGGPHMAVGGHNSIIRYASADIARKVGGTLIAPVIDFAPSGRINPPEGNMQFAGTVALREETYEALLEDVATSLKQHGFRVICFIGDSLGASTGQEAVARQLNNRWSSQGIRVIYVDSYSRIEPQYQWAQSAGAMTLDPMAHAGLAETSQLLAVSPQSVRTNLIGAYGEKDYTTTGASGDATQANAANGRGFLAVKINAAIRQIKETAGRSN